MKHHGMIFNAEMVRAILDGRKTQTRRMVKPQPQPKGSWLTEGERDATLSVIWCEVPDIERVCGKKPAWYKAESPIRVGDIIWVREMWGLMRYYDVTDWCRDSISQLTQFDIQERWLVEHAENWRLPHESAYWRPSIHMPRWASRVELEVTAVRVERVQEISEEDAKAEGVFRRLDGPDMEFASAPNGTMHWNAKGAFRDLWQSIYANRPSLPENTRSKRYARVKRWLEKNPPQGWDANPWVWVYEFRRVK
jgi:hypothetical protein